MTDTTLYTVKLSGLVLESGDFSKTHIQGLAKALAIAGGVMLMHADDLEPGAKLSIIDESGMSVTMRWRWEPKSYWLSQ